VKPISFNLERHQEDNSIWVQLPPIALHVKRRWLGFFERRWNVEKNVSSFHP
jgi:hypothetical protein